MIKECAGKQELIGLIAKEGFTLVGDIATRKQESLRTKAAEARTHNNEAKAESYEKKPLSGLRMVSIGSLYMAS